MAKLLSIENLIIAAILAALIVQLNFYFAWTSHVGAPNWHVTNPTRAFFVNEVNYVTKVQLSLPGVLSYFENVARHSGHYGSTLYGISMRYFVDYEVVAFTLLIFAFSILLFRSKGIWVALLRAFEITSAAAVPLGLEIYYWDYREFNIHASVVQVKFGLAWFTNADVLYASVAILSLSLTIDAIRCLRNKRAKQQRGPIRPAQSPYAVPVPASA